MKRQLKIATAKNWSITLLSILCTILLISNFFCTSSSSPKEPCDDKYMSVLNQLLHSKYGRSDPRFVEPVTDSTCLSDMNHYRSNVKDEYGVIYEPKDILTYFACIWPQLTTKPPPDPDFHWALGFYFAHKLVKGKRELCFYVIPTLSKNIQNQDDPAIVSDYYSYWKNPLYYDHDPKTTVCADNSGTKLSGGGTGNAYDAGQLWP